MAATIDFYLSGVIAIAIILVGCRFLLAPSRAAVLMAYRLASNRIRERIYPLNAFVTLHRDCSPQSLLLTGPHTSLAGSCYRHAHSCR